MPYQKTNWIQNVTPLDATNLNNMENQIEATDIIVSEISEKLLNATNVYTSASLKGDGTDTTQQIKDFFSSIPNHSKVYISGTYYLDDIIVIKDKTRIWLEFAEDAHFKANKHGYGILEINNCKFVQASGHGKFEGYGNFPPLVSDEKQGAKVLGMWGICRNDEYTLSASYGGGHLYNAGIGIFITDGCENVLIEDQEFFNFNYSGINVDTTRYASYATGVPTSVKTSSQITYCKNIIIRNNDMHDIYSAGIILSTVDGFTVFNNRVENIGHPSALVTDVIIDPGYGVSTTQSVTHAKSGVISHNYFKGCKRKSIDAHAGEMIDIHSNSCFNSWVAGIAYTWVYSDYVLKNYSIHDNTVVDCGLGSTDNENSCGILAEGLDYRVHDNLIINSGVDYGIWANSASNSTPNVNNCMVNNNRIKNSLVGFQTKYGIGLKGDGFIESHNNIIVGNLMYGITVSGCDVNVDKNKIDVAYMGLKVMGATQKTILIGSKNIIKPPMNYSEVTSGIVYVEKKVIDLSVNITQGVVDGVTKGVISYTVKNGKGMISGLGSDEHGITISYFDAYDKGLISDDNKCVCTLTHTSSASAIKFPKLYVRTYWSNGQGLTIGLGTDGNPYGVTGDSLDAVDLSIDVRIEV